MILTITIRPPAPPTNQPPSVDAGLDRSGFVNLAILLDATVSDPDPADVLTVAWSAGGAPCTFVTNSAVDTAVICSSAGVFVLTLAASDGVNPPVSDSVTVTVTKAPKANCKSNPVNHETAAGSSYRSGKRVCRPPHRRGSVDTSVRSCRAGWVTEQPAEPAFLTESQRRGKGSQVAWRAPAASGPPRCHPAGFAGRPATLG